MPKPTAKKRIKGRAKGSRFEREVAKQIVAAFAHLGITAEHCFRTPLSGGHIHASKKDPGDHQIAAELRSLYEFCNECKNYKQVNWLELLAPSSAPLKPKQIQTVRKGKIRKSRSSGPKLRDWWAQAKAAAAAQHLPPLVIFKSLRSPAFALGFAQDLKVVPQSVPLFFSKIGTDTIRVVLFSQLLDALVLRASQSKSA